LKIILTKKDNLYKVNASVEGATFAELRGMYSVTSALPGSMTKRT